MSKTNNNIVVLFVEGETDKLFYERLVRELREEKQEKFRRDIEIIIKNVKGVGQYKRKVARVIKSEIKRDNPHCHCCAILCHDTDVFEFSSKPPFKWSEVVAELKKSGVDKVKFVRASHSIEDWLLIDGDGVLDFLKLSKQKNKVNRSNSGLKELERLFRQAGRTYIKGKRCEGLIESLDMRKIVVSILGDLKAICEELINMS